MQLGRQVAQTRLLSRFMSPHSLLLKSSSGLIISWILVLTPSTNKESMRLQDRAARSVAWSSVDNWGRQILSFVVYAALARLVGPESFGVIAIAGVYVAFVQIFVTQGFSTAVIQRKKLEPEHLDSAFWINLTVAILLCLSTILLSSPMATLFQEPKVSPVLMWLSALFPIFAFSTVPTAILTRKLEFKVLAIRSLAGTGIGGGVGLLMAFHGQGVWSLVAQQLVAASVGVVCIWWATSWRPKLTISVRHLQELYSFALNILGNDILWFFSQRSDQTLVGYGFGATGLGPYALAQRLINIVMEALGGPLQSVALPTLSRLQDDPKRLKAAFYRFTEIGALVSFPAFAGIIAIAPDIVQIVFGNEWFLAVPILRVLAFYGALRVAFSFIHPLMLSKGRPGLYLLMFIVHASATFLACLVAILWHPTAVAVAVTAVMVLYSIGIMPILRRVLDITGQELCKALASPLLASVAMLGLVSLTRLACPNEGLRLLLSIIVGMISYASLLLLLCREMAAELQKFCVSRLAAWTFLFTKKI